MKFTSQYDLVVVNKVITNNVKSIAIKRFENMLELNSYLKSSEQMSEFNTKHKLKSYFGPTSDFTSRVHYGWYGASLKDELKVSSVNDIHSKISNHNNLVYDNMDFVQKLTEQINEKLSANVQDTVPKKKLAYNDMGLGVFSFDRAAQGMYRLNEFFSPVRNEVVDSMYVEQTGSVYKDVRDNAILQMRKELKPDGTIKVRTTTKKVYAFFPKVKRQKAAVDIYIGVGNSADLKETEYMYTAIGAIVFANMLTKASIPFRITAVFGAVSYSQSKYCASIATIKDYNETLDSSLVAKLTGDAAYGRYTGNMLLYLSLMKYTKHYDDASPINAMTLSKIIAEYNEELKTSLNIAAPNNVVCFSGAKSLNESVLDVKLAIDKVNRLLNS